MKLYFYPCRIEGKIGLELAITDPSATVEDLVEAIQPWCADQYIYKQYLNENRGSCEGCPVNCCRESMVIPDVVSFQRLCRTLEVEAEEFFARYIDPEMLKQGLPSIKSSPCVFLNDKLCSVYQSCTLICRFYLCTLISDRASSLLYRVIAAGTGEFIRWARSTGRIPAEARPSEKGFNRMLWDLIHPESISPDNPFQGVSSYQEVPLKHFLDSLGQWPAEKTGNGKTTEG